VSFGDTFLVSDYQITPPVLDPVVEEGLKDLTAWVYRRRRLIRDFGRPKWERSLKNSSCRSAAIHLCKALKSRNYHFRPDELHDWAVAHGWPAEDAEDLREYAKGVLEGERYHTDPNPFGWGWPWQTR
jgi:hypothetical protein